MAANFFETLLSIYQEALLSCQNANRLFFSFTKYLTGLRLILLCIPGVVKETDFLNSRVPSCFHKIDTFSLKFFWSRSYKAYRGRRRPNSCPEFLLALAASKVSSKSGG
jgi:hypothetical protein